MGIDHSSCSAAAKKMPKWSSESLLPSCTLIFLRILACRCPMGKASLTFLEERTLPYAPIMLEDSWEGRSNKPFAPKQPESPSSDSSYVDLFGVAFALACWSCPLIIVLSTSMLSLTKAREGVAWARGAGLEGLSYDLIPTPSSSILWTPSSYICESAMTLLSFEDQVDWDVAPTYGAHVELGSVGENTNYRILTEEDTTRIMTELILKECKEKTQAESSLAKPNTDDVMNIELSKEFLMELQSNVYHGMFDKDVVDHIAKVLEILDLIKIPYVDSHQLRMKVFPLSLADDARQWFINKGDGKITTWEELVEIFFYKFYPESCDGKDEMLDEGDN
ncbi:hypothetical protein Tco_0382778 [Tanacetum coccineum]